MFVRAWLVVVYMNTRRRVCDNCSERGHDRLFMLYIIVILCTRAERPPVAPAGIAP